MSTTRTLQDSATMLDRNIRHTLRSPDTMIMTIALPVMIMLMFVYVFGGAMDVGSGRLHRLRGARNHPAVRGFRRVDHRGRAVDGRGRGHHRPVPHHGHRPLGGTHRARRRAA